MSEISDARALVRDELGAVLEAKASDSFCLDYRRRQAAGFAEAAGAAPASVVVELREEDDATRADDREVIKRSRGTGLHERFGGVLSEAVGAASRGGDAVNAVRGIVIQRRRERFLRAAAPVREQLERTATSLRARSRTPAAAAEPSTAVCWLNRSLRASTEPDALAEVAGEPELARIDLARKLTPDLDVSAGSIAAPDYRDRTGATGAGVIVAVIDFEVFSGHPALASRIVHQANHTGESFGTPGRHGTAVAGIIASGDDRFTGIAPAATIYSYKVLSNIPIFSADDFFGSLAIQQALEDGAQVANCSWGAGPAGDGTSREARACDEAWALGMPIVKSAGNKGSAAGTITTPADAEGVIVVGATDRQGTHVGDYSSRGPTTDGRGRPHLVAPGGLPEEGIWSCTADGGFGDVTFGTSFAAPHVTGLIALMLEREPALAPDEIREKLLKSCRKLAGDENTQGAGIVDASGLL